MGRSSKDKRDIFYRLAKEEGWRARSAFKLLQIQQTLNILDGVTRAVDLCAAPGSWSQVLAQVLQPKNQGEEAPYIVAVDLQTMSPIPGVKCIKGDITSEDTARQIIDALGGSKAQIVVCDGAPDVTGLHELDERLQSQLLFAALSIATCILEENGTFVSKFFRASEEGIRFNFSRVKYFFDDVTLAKPRSSRASSMECFIVGRKFKLPQGFKPQVPFPEWPANIVLQRSEIPFLSCGDLSGFDSETTYPLPPDYVYREPVQKPIDPPYASAVELRKKEKISSKLAVGDVHSQPEVKGIKVAKYSYNPVESQNAVITRELEGLSLNPSFFGAKQTSDSNSLATLPGASPDESGQSIASNTFQLVHGKPELQKWSTIADPSAKISSTVSALGEEAIKLHFSFRGGLELLFGGIKEMPICLPHHSSGESWTMEHLLKWMKENIIQERPELFIKDDDIRPGILIFINDTDWELLEKLDYELAQGDRISFISTLHGG